MLTDGWKLQNAPDGGEQKTQQNQHHPQGDKPEINDLGPPIDIQFGLCQLEQPAVTKALAKFQNMGLVELRPSTTDKRSKTVIATAKTGQLLGTIYQGIGPELHKTFSVIDPDNIEAFIKQLKQLGQWMEKNRQSPKR